MTDTHWLAVQAVATAATGTILLVTLIVAWRSLLHTRGQREDQFRPHVVVDIEPSAVRPMVDFVVRNLGQTAARDVRIATNPTLQTTTDDAHPKYALKDSAILAQGIPMLPPGREIRSLFDSMPDLLNTGLPTRYEGTVTYDGSRGGKTYHDEFVIDLNVHAGLTYIDQKGLHQVAKALEEVARRLGQWSESHHGLRVFVQDWPSWAWQSGRLIRHPRPSIRGFQEWIDDVRRRRGLDPITWSPHRRRTKRRRAAETQRRQAAGR